VTTRIDHPIDVIGDVHGMYGRLRDLLSALGYARRDGRWSHEAGHRLVFVGDYVDRGRRPREAVALVRDLCDDGMAIALLGNHDSNAIAFCMRAGRAVLDPQGAWHEGRSALGTPRLSRRWLRRHHHLEEQAEFKNVRQHAATLAGFDDPAAYEAAVRWFTTLPVWLELPGLRVVHAAWIPRAVACLDRWVASRGLPSLGLRAPGFDEALALQRARAASAPGEEAWHELLDLRGVPHAHQVPADRTPAVALERLLKGVEIRLPEGVSLPDADGHGRNEIRMRWFEAARGRSFADVALMNTGDVARLAEVARGHVIDAGRPGFDGVDALVCYSPADAYGPDERPVIFGHYGLRLGAAPGHARLLGCAAANVACVDTAATAKAAEGGTLTAYRWAGEPRLSGERFVGVSLDCAEDHAPAPVLDGRCTPP
jgi:hypothetical protein